MISKLLAVDHKERTNAQFVVSSRHLRLHESDDEGSDCDSACSYCDPVGCGQVVLRDITLELSGRCRDEV
jgi:hypothetical protein